MDRSELAVGQEVVVFVHYGRGWTRCAGRVLKIARKYATIEYTYGARSMNIASFDIETQKIPSKYSYSTNFSTLEQQDVLDRKDAADKGLRYYGIVLHHDVPGTGDRLALEHQEAIVALLDERIGRD